MKQVILVVSVVVAAGWTSLAQTAGDVWSEANPEYVEVVDNSPAAQMWRQIVAARKAGDENLHATLVQQYLTLYPQRFSSTSPTENGPWAIQGQIPSERGGNSLDWGNGDIMISPTAILSPIVAGNPRSLRLRVDSLGNKYAAFIAGNRDSLCVYKSTDHGLSWTRILIVLPGGTTKWHSFDFFITDSGAVHRLGFAATRTLADGGFGGQIYWMSAHDNGSNFTAVQIATRPAGRGYVNPAIVSDGHHWSAGATYWYAAFQNVDSTTGVGNQALAAVSVDWGATWQLDTARNSFNDFDLDIDYNFAADTIAVLLTNDIIATNANLRLMTIPLGGFATASTWRQLNVAATSDPEFGGVLASNRQSNALLVMFTRTQSSNDNIGYGYSPTGAYPLSHWNLDQILVSGANDENRVDLDCQESQGAFRAAYISKGPSRDTVIYTSAFAPPFSGHQIVNADRDASTSTAPSVAGFRQSASGFGGGVLFAGFGPIGAFYDGSNIFPTDVRPTGEIPETFALEQNYPNPFNPTTTIRFQVPVLSDVTLTVYDVLGREVETLVNDSKGAGVYEVTWNAANLSSGVYYYRLTAGSFSDVKKLLLLK